MRRAHVPLLFAEYLSSTCYRDWKDADASFLADHAVQFLQDEDAAGRAPGIQQGLEGLAPVDGFFGIDIQGGLVVAGQVHEHGRLPEMHGNGWAAHRPEAYRGAGTPGPADGSTPVGRAAASGA